MSQTKITTKKATQPEDPKQWIVMRTDLKMRKGKMIAQGAHASMKVLLDRAVWTNLGDNEKPRMTVVLRNCHEGLPACRVGRAARRNL